jgi:serine/threonine protein kinase
MSKNFQAENEIFRTFYGSPAYLFPELIQKQPYSTKSDIWGLGIILYEMIMGKRPFDHPNIVEFFKNIRESEPNYAGISNSLKNLLEGMLKKNQNDRISLFQLRSYYSLQETLYYQSLNKILGNIAGRKEENLIGNIQSESVTKESYFIMKQILVRDKVTDLIRNANRLKCFILETSLIENIKNQTEEEEKILTMIRKNSP